MNKAIVVTGTPGTGKTTVAKKLAKKAGLSYIDVNTVIARHKLSEGYDRKRKCKVIDVKRLNKVLVGMIKDSEKTLVIDSHLSHYLPPEYVKLCIVTKCDLKSLKKRLAKRGYPEKKIKENLECEIFDVCLTEAKEAGHKTIVTQTSKKIDFVALIHKLKLKKKLKK